MTVLPSIVDNRFRGHPLALWLLALHSLMKLVIGLNSAFNGYYVAGTIDGIPLSSYTPEGAAAVVSLFGLLGIANAIFAVLCLLVLVRYRALVPLMFLLLAIEQVARKVFLDFMPVAKSASAAGSVIGWTIFALVLVGLVLSARARPRPAGGQA